MSGISFRTASWGLYVSGWVHCIDEREGLPDLQVDLYTTGELLYGAIMIENPTFTTTWVFSNGCLRQPEQTITRRTRRVLRYVKSRRDETQEEPAGFFDMPNRGEMRHKKNPQGSSL